MTGFRRAIAESATAKARYGDDARQSDDPIESYFDNVADAQAIADERQALLSVERRRFKVTAKAVDEVAAFDLTAGIPVARFIDRQSDADRPALVSEIVIDLAKQSTTTTLWG
ncbi:UNVERIFIED_ORG: hypothetical protein M2348_001343 [Sphingomonas sp. R1F5B]